MPEKVKNNQDKNLIKKCFGYEPLDWARYKDGTLAVINPDGQKHTYTVEELNGILEVSKAATKRAAPPKKKSAAPASAAKKPAAAASSKKKSAADPEKKSGTPAKK